MWNYLCQLVNAFALKYPGCCPWLKFIFILTLPARLWGRDDHCSSKACALVGKLLDWALLPTGDNSLASPSGAQFESLKATLGRWTQSLASICKECYCHIYQGMLFYVPFHFCTLFVSTSWQLHIVIYVHIVSNIIILLFLSLLLDLFFL